MKNYILILLSFCTLTTVRAQNYSLNDNWSFSELGKDEWKPAYVPGNVHLDLQLNGVISDPTIGENYKTSAWVETKDWEYRMSFNYPDALHFQNNELVFEGLDTYADIYLNGELILKTDNMFQKYVLPVKAKIKENENILRIVFHNPVNYTKQMVANAGLTYPASNDASCPFTRKEAIQYGWDFTQRQLTCGIWRNISLRCWNSFVIRDLHVVQKKLAINEALMEAVVEVEAMTDDTLFFDLVKDRTTLHAPVKKGVNTITIPYRIADPQLWWPNGMGPQRLYPLYVQVTNKNRFDWKQIEYGLRMIEVRNKPDDKGTSFTVVVNGVPLYMKGTNYVPQLNKYKTGYSNYTYENIFATMKNCNMNMVRVWGGGVYEDDAFYKLADQNGILVWQDFMFSGTMYPGDSLFLKNVAGEVAYNIKRLRNHPSLALWCGNNEVEVAWKNWGWQKTYKYSALDSIRLWNDYKKLFEELLPEKVKELDAGRFYFSSTPQSNWGKPEDLKYGDNHYWGVWHGEEPFSSYLTKIPRFMSEFGFQSFPSTTSLLKFTAKNDWSINSPVLMAHQFSYKGTGLIEKYMALYYKKPKDFESWIYLSQLLQAEGMKIAIEAQRRAMPFCMGSLCWQLNDNWPAASWSTIDFYGKWKAAQYFLKKAYAPVLLSAFLEKNVLHVAGINDTPKSVSGKLVLTIMKMDGTIVNEIQQDANIPSGKSTPLFHDSLPLFCKNVKPNECFLVMRLISDTNTISSNIFYFAPVKDLLLQKPLLNYTLKKEGNKIMMIVTTNVPAKNVLVTIVNTEMINGTSDNYFDLLPGEQKVLNFYSDRTAEELKKLVVLKTLRDTY